MITVRGTDQPEYKVSSAPEKDDWDSWNKDRDNVVRDAESWGHTNRYYTGVNDLDSTDIGFTSRAMATFGSLIRKPRGRHIRREDGYGNHITAGPGYLMSRGAGRHITMAAGFITATTGAGGLDRCMSHYRPLWSPAFVFFVGFGHHSGFGFGSIGWFPVGPHDPFYPWYGRGFNRVNVVNITYVINNFHGHGGFIAPLAVRGRQPYYSNAHLALTNPHVRGSITSVSSENFGRGGHEGWRHGVEEHELRESRVMTANLPVVPSRESLHAGSGKGAAPAGIQTRNNDRFFTKHEPPAAGRNHSMTRCSVCSALWDRKLQALAHGNSGGATNGASERQRRAAFVQRKRAH